MRIFKVRILTFFLLMTSLFCIILGNVGCAKPLAKANFPYPKIFYDEKLNTDVIPSDFAETLKNRFKILYEKSPNLALKEVYFYFSDYYNEAKGETPPFSSLSFSPNYYFTLHLRVVTQTHTQNFSQQYVIPTLAFNPPYSQQFDGILLKILQTRADDAKSLH